MRLGTAIMICTLALACLVQPAVAQRVDLHLSTDSLTVGDRVLLTLVAMHRLDRQPEFPAIANDSVFGDLHVLGLQSEGVRYGADGSRIDSVVYEATTFELDTVRIPPIPVAFEGGAFYRESAPVEIYVTSLVSESDTVILGMTDPVGFGRPVWPFVLLGLALVLCVALAVYLVRRSRAPKVIAPSIGPPVRAPHELALARLRALENAPLVRRAHVEAFFVWNCPMRYEPTLSTGWIYPRWNQRPRNWWKTFLDRPCSIGCLAVFPKRSAKSSCLPIWSSLQISLHPTTRAETQSARRSA